MPLQDYTESIERLQKMLGKGFVDEPWMLNVPGKSIACKIDQYYYLAVMPAFVDQLGRLGGMFPDQVTEVLVKTGNVITNALDRNPVLPITVSWGGRGIGIRAAFVEADFIDRAVKIYGDMGSSLNVSDLKISQGDEATIKAFFEGKTPPQKLAYY